MLSLAAALALGAPAVYAQAAHDHGAATPTLNQGQKWRTDAPLRHGMENIRAALGEPESGALARKINAEVAGIVQNCKLEPEADEQLHLVIAELLAGAEARDRGRIAKALNAYGEHFDHAGWTRL